MRGTALVPRRPVEPPALPAIKALRRRAGSRSNSTTRLAFCANWIHTDGQPASTRADYNVDVSARIMVAGVTTACPRNTLSNNVGRRSPRFPTVRDLGRP